MIWFEAIFFTLFVLASVVQPLFIIGMLIALNSLRVQRLSDQVVLKGRDAVPFAMGLIGACAGCVLLGCLRSLLPLHGFVVALLGLVLFALPLGCRVKVEVGHHEATGTRTVAWVVPWRIVSLECPTAFVDGWGDFSDPAALHVGDEVGGFAVELGWPGKSDKADVLATRFNESVRALRRSGGLRR